MQVAREIGIPFRVSKGPRTSARPSLWARLPCPVRAWMGLPVLITAAGALARTVPLLARYPLHRDEALYGAWARLIASGTDPLLLTAWVDKPPLAIYLMACSLRVFGSSEIALRLPGMVAGIVCVPLIYAWAQRAYGRPTGVLAAVLFAASPFAILFAPTAFTDPWLMFWMLAGAWTALAGKSFLAGVVIGLAIASKQQGLLAVPLVVALLGMIPVLSPAEHVSLPAGGSRHSEYRRQTIHRLLLALAGFLVVFIPLTYWDSLRWARRPSFWGRSLDTYGGLGVAPPGQWGERAAAWAGQIKYLFGLPPLSAALLVAALLPACRTCWRLRNGQGGEAPAFAEQLDLLLGLYVACYLALHLFLTFQPWDRYLLPLVPWVAILAARGLSLVYDQMRYTPALNGVRAPPSLGLAALLAWGMWQGVAGQLPVGSDHGAFQGLDRVVAFVQTRPPNALVYHHSLGWYFDYYLFDAPQERLWWDNSWKLADLAERTARIEPGREQWLVLAGSEDASVEQLPSALAAWGLGLSQQEAISRSDGSRAFTVYRILPTQGPATP